jgi:hypothetical protein
LAAIAAAVAFAGAPALASTMPWQLSSVRGLVVYLQDGKWQELDPSQSLGSKTLRTLRSGHVSVESKNLKIDVGPNSALKFSPSPDGASASIDQYEGSVSVSMEQENIPAPLVLRVGKITLSRIAGDIEVSVADKAVSVVVKSGSVSAALFGAKPVQLVAGDYETDATGAALIADTSNGDAVATQDTAGATGLSNDSGPGPVGKGNSNSGGNGSGTGAAGNSSGGNGNGSGNNGGSNNGGNGNGNGGSNNGGSNNGGSNNGGSNNGNGDGKSKS